ncbi:unnamed protein product [Euphydryas editha]|uniref:FP protein C-terminal domain-containing protein n=1 Tax=Euphydryas editha TaxID=104508 RepID=A0AAU9TY46_EUPED|nr:unnamed protein product [Euphydryas editha]
MSLQRTPPRNISTESACRPEALVSYGSDPQLLSQFTNEIREQNTPPNYVSFRNKRPRETGTSPSDFSRFKDEIKDLVTSLICEQKQDIREISSSLKELAQINTGIESAVSLLTQQNENFRKKIEQLEQQSKKDREYISILENKIEDLQRWSRKSSIELKNVPRKPKENRSDLVNVVVNLSKTVNLELCPRDIKDVYRLKSKKESEKNPPVIVELPSTIMKTDLIKKIKEFNYKNKSKLQAKHLGFTINEDTPVFVSEQLTAKGSRLYFLSRDLVKTNMYKYCWTSYGKVFVRKDDTSKIIHIQNEAQIHHLMQEK